MPKYHAIIGNFTVIEGSNVDSIARQMPTSLALFTIFVGHRVFTAVDNSEMPSWLTPERQAEKYHAFLGDFSVIEDADLESLIQRIGDSEIVSCVVIFGYQTLVVNPYQSSVSDPYPDELRDADVDKFTMADAVEMAKSVNHPPHYTQGNVECIDAMEACSTPDEFAGHLRLTAIKYLWRLNNKGNPLENLAKAIWYLRRLEDFLTDRQTNKPIC